MTLLPTSNAPTLSLLTSGIIVSVLALTGCQSTSIEPHTDTSHPVSSHTSLPMSPQINQQTLEQQALHIQNALANGNYASIANDIHPTRGVRFSMYAYVRPKADKVFTRTQYTQYLEQAKIRFTWGEKDGTGEPLVTSLPNYLQTWVNAEVFVENATIKVNDSQASGNSINNLNKIYQKSDYVEFYSNGSDQYSGMDWRAMRLVFDNYQGQRYLVAIISDQWTV